MPVSDKQLAANQANAQKSTGPRTAEGKRISSQNATRHGILANTVLIEGESHDRFVELFDGYAAEFKPRTPSEKTLVENMVVARWRQMRVWSYEAAGMTREVQQQAAATVNANPPTRGALAFQSLSQDGNHMDLINRYDTRYDRQYHRAFDRFLRLREKQLFAKQTQIAVENKEPAQ